MYFVHFVFILSKYNFQWLVLTKYILYCSHLNDAILLLLYIKIQHTITNSYYSNWPNSSDIIFCTETHFSGWARLWFPVWAFQTPGFHTLGFECGEKEDEKTAIVPSYDVWCNGKQTVWPANSRMTKPCCLPTLQFTPRTASNQKGPCSGLRFRNATAVGQ